MCARNQGAMHAAPENDSRAFLASAWACSSWSTSTLSIIIIFGWTIATSTLARRTLQTFVWIAIAIFTASWEEYLANSAFRWRKRSYTNKQSDIQQNSSHYLLCLSCQRKKKSLTMAFSVRRTYALIIRMLIGWTKATSDTGRSAYQCFASDTFTNGGTRFNVYRCVGTYGCKLKF